MLAWLIPSIAVAILVVLLAYTLTALHRASRPFQAEQELFKRLLVDGRRYRGEVVSRIAANAGSGKHQSALMITVRFKTESGEKRRAVIPAYIDNRLVEHVAPGNKVGLLCSRHDPELIALDRRALTSRVGAR